MPHATLRRAAPAKINLGLHVLRRRADGYHDIETVLVPIGWADELRAAPAPALTLRCDDPTLPTDERNLVMRAAGALARRAGVDSGAALELDKRVPYGAGLGSGSSDAATTLHLLSELWELDLPPGDLHALAADLGSDVPFFVDARAAVATGRGDDLDPLRDAAGQPYALPFTLVVAVPPQRVSTADAYALVQPRAGRRADLREVVLSDDPERWRRELVNDFQAPIAARHPEIGQALDRLTAAGAGYASLSGSGSAVFGVFERAADADEAVDLLRRAGCSTRLEQPGR